MLENSCERLEVGCEDLDAAAPEVVDETGAGIVAPGLSAIAFGALTALLLLLPVSATSTGAPVGALMPRNLRTAASASCVLMASASCR